MAKAKKLKSGSWRVLVYDYTDENKKRHYKSFTAPTRKQAEYMAAEYSLSRRGSSYEDLTLSEAYERYINSKSSVLSPSTIREYKRSHKNHFQKLMPMKLSKITSEIIQTAVNEASASYSPKSVRNMHGLLHSVIKAYRPELVINVRLPQRIKPDYVIPTTKDIQILLRAADNKIRVPILLASSGSLRRSEICALRPDDVTEFGVNVTKAKVYNEKNECVIKPPKTKAGYRFVPLPSEIIAEVRKWKYFDCTPSEIDNCFKKLVKSCDVPHISFHKLRHYFASECHAKNIPDQYIAKIGGWENVEMLHKIYQHTLRDKQETFNDNIVNIFSANFSNKKPKKRTAK